MHGYLMTRTAPPESFGAARESSKQVKNTNSKPVCVQSLVHRHSVHM